MAQSLFEHGQITTTLPKAKDLRPFAERLITLARKARTGDLAARQRLVSLMGDRAMIPAEFQEQYEDMSDAVRDKVLRSRSGRRHRTGQAKGGLPFTAMSVVHHLINNVAGNYEDRPGGYTRLIRLAKRQKGSSALLAMVQLVGNEESPGTVTRPEKTARKRRTERRYAAAARLTKKQQAKPVEEKAPADEAPPAEQESPESSEQQGDAEKE
jgi:large subunit ribosomal protein L17